MLTGLLLPPPLLLRPIRSPSQPPLVPLVHLTRVSVLSWTLTTHLFSEEIADPLVRRSTTAAARPSPLLSPRLQLTPLPRLEPTTAEETDYEEIDDTPPPPASTTTPRTATAVTVPPTNTTSLKPSLRTSTNNLQLSPLPGVIASFPKRHISTLTKIRDWTLNVGRKKPNPG